MRTVSWAPSFRRAFRRHVRRHPELRDRIRQVIDQLVADPFGPSLDTHKLRGELAGLRACSVAYDCRIVFDFVGSQENPVLLLIDIGTHDEVY